MLCDQSIVVPGEKSLVGGQPKVMRTVGFSLSDEHRADAMLDLALTMCYHAFLSPRHLAATMWGISVYQTLSAISQRAANLSEQKSRNKSMTDKPNKDKGKIKANRS